MSPTMTDEELDVLGVAISKALPAGKHFVCLVIGEGQTRLEIVSDIRNQAMVAGLCEWGKSVVLGEEDEEAASKAAAAAGGDVVKLQ